MSKQIEKKILSQFFEKVASGKKTYELRLADWDCQPGDILVLVEIDGVTKRPTGRSLRRRVGFVGKTKDYNFWPQADVKKYGYQIISLLEEES